jgi:hypothetical protein
MISAFVRYFKLEYSRLKLLECIEARAAMPQVMKHGCACIKSLAPLSGHPDREAPGTARRRRKRVNRLKRAFSRLDIQRSFRRNSISQSTDRSHFATISI